MNSKLFILNLILCLSCFILIELTEGAQVTTPKKVITTQSTALATKDPNKKFNDALESFVKTRNKTKLQKNGSKNLALRTSNFRTTTDQGDLVNDLFDFVKSYVNNSDTVSSRSLVGPIITVNSTYCPYQNQNIKCNSSSIYRSYDGTCNNLKNPLLGAINTPYTRVLNPAYQDGFNSPRTLSITGSTLPNPRKISLAISVPHPAQTLSNNITHLYALWGQFLAHDMLGTSAITDTFGNEISCDCSSKSSACMAFSVPPNDSFLGQTCQKTGSSANDTCYTNGYTSQTCMNFTRSSATFPDFNCSISYREQLNLLSSFIDGTAIYGINQTINTQLRSFKNGMLLTSSGLSGPTSSILPNQILTNRTYLPRSNDTCSRAITPQYPCFYAGEYRTSENLGLVGIQTLFNREHNRIASQLVLLNPKWTDEIIFQETRRIVIAQLQHITYNEFVPVLTGNRSLSPLNASSYFTGYNSASNPQVSNEFATAAFRMGHSMIRQVSTRSDLNQSYFATKNTYLPAFNFENNLFQTDMAFNNQTQGLNGVFLGTLNDLSWKFGTFGQSLQNNLFQSNLNQSIPNAFDLLALNINRGRDHGLQPYVKYVQKCLNINITNFSMLSTTGLMNRFNANQLASVYQNVNDIDLYAGGLSEAIVANQAYGVGPTFGCILMEQFAILKTSDRFYYENGPSTNFPGAFTLNQLAQIKNVTLAGLICANYDLYQIQKYPFYLVNSTKNPLNPYIDCSLLKNQINLSYWQTSSSG